MTTGERIRNARKNRGLTQNALGKLTGMSYQQIGQYETGKRTPKMDSMNKIAHALNVNVWSLFDEADFTARRNDCFWSSYLDDKLNQVGCRIAFDEDNAMIWIEMPDGTLEVTEQDLKELDDSTVSYLQFKLEELKKKHPEDFRPRKNKVRSETRHT